MPFWVLNGHSEQQPRETAEDCRYLLRQIIKLSVVFYIAMSMTVCLAGTCFLNKININMNSIQIAEEIPLQNHVTRLYRLYNRCSGRYLQMYVKAINARGKSKSPLTLLKVETDCYGGRVRIQSKKFRKYLCFNRKLRVTARYNGRSENCVFVERISENFYTEFESASQKGAFLGFNSRGLFLHPTMRSREPHCFQFIKEEQINPIEEFRGIDYGPSRRIRSRAKWKKKNHTQPNITLTPQLFELPKIEAVVGQNASHLEKETTDEFPANDHFYGLVNFGNTCYCNSVIQALYFCRPFREKVLNYKSQMKKAGNQKENLLLCLADLFHSISTQKRRVGTIAPKKFIGRLKKENDLFDNYMQQDAHEFLNYLLNTVADILLEEKRHEKRISGGHKVGSKGTTDTVSQTDGFGDNASSNQTQVKDKLAEHTWVHDVFQGTLTNETRCLNCETVSSKDEDFLDLSVDVQQNTSITHCLREFSATETLCNEHKYYCDICCSKQEAQKRMRIKKLPLILALHLKRFKYVEQYNRYTKLSYRVLFPLELRLFNTSHDAVNPDRMYDLVAVVVHCGSTPNRGHYITVVKSQGFWLLFDDDVVDKMDHINIEDFFGMAADGSLQKNSESGYILFYQARDI
ncbi:Ubiquitin carboxyl-terminal hydrolase 46 [Trichinella spiralis]|uniref:Ubiquitin carboxyl-terminal hydrolase n=1 Tax=Trichinella spiralis TaxID=6334 RepID=A0A0V1BWH7_TRISP|nr:Ubiquitin carboxyl-terminal hydrolase 46 [Trichinella spiralis]